ncbi:MAG: hypothetical protein IPQ07_34260 [Myxococcales bacterium]|nr:hypothetical protein [Myxococcales bacterium]
MISVGRSSTRSNRPSSLIDWLWGNSSSNPRPSSSQSGSIQAERGRQVQVAFARKQLSGRPESSVREVIAHRCIELQQQLEQSLDVLRRPPMDDVEIVGGDRRTLDHAGGTTDDDELDPGVAQLREQRGKISGLRVRRHLGS